MYVRMITQVYLKPHFPHSYCCFVSWQLLFVPISFTGDVTRQIRMGDYGYNIKEPHDIVAHQIVRSHGSVGERYLGSHWVGTTHCANTLCTTNFANTLCYTRYTACTSGMVPCHVLLCSKSLNFNKYCTMVQVPCPYLSCLKFYMCQFNIKLRYSLQNYFASRKSFITPK